MKIVLHIGADKTGTTAIQQFLAQNIELLNSARIEYPNILPNDIYPRAHGWAAIDGINVNGNGYPLFEDFSLLQKIVNTLILDPINHNKTFIFSSERLLKTFADEFTWNNLAQISESNNVKIAIIAYCRDAIPYLASMYTEQIKSAGESRKFSEYISGVPTNPDLAPHSQYFPQILQLSRNFPQLEFSIFRYETYKKDLAEHFLLAATNSTLLGVLPPKGDANRSLTNLEGNFLVGLNEVNPDLGRQIGWRITALPAIDDRKLTISEGDIGDAKPLCEDYVSAMRKLVLGSESPEIGDLDSNPDSSFRYGNEQIHQLGKFIGNFIKDGK